MNCWAAFSKRLRSGTRLANQPDDWPTLADLQVLTENFLPKAAIDKTTFRMSELLRQRWGASEHKDPPKLDSVAHPAHEPRRSA